MSSKSSLRSDTYPVNNEIDETSRLLRNDRQISDYSHDSDNHDDNDNDDNNQCEKLSWYTRLYKKNIGFLLLILAQACFAVMDFSAKLLQSDVAGPPIPTWEIIFVRMGVTGIGCTIYIALFSRSEPFLGPRNVMHLLAVRGAASFFIIMGFYLGLRFLSLSDAICLGFIAPIIIAIMASIFLGEPYSIFEASAAIISLFGVVLIAKPKAIFGHESDDFFVINHLQKRTIGVFGVLLAVFAEGVAFLMLRKIGNKASPTRGILHYSIYSVILSSCLYGIMPNDKPVWPTPGKWVLFVVVSGFGLASQILITLGLRREKAGRGSLAVYIQLPIATAIDAFYFKTKFDNVFSFLGIGLIILCSLITVIIGALREEDNSQSDSNNRSNRNSISNDAESASIH